MDDSLLCNKCFATTIRGKKPFYLTQCGHIYCNGCIKQAEKQCPQCQQVGVFSAELKRPLISKVEEFFVPLEVSLATLNKVYGFQNYQKNLLIQRFHEIDKKYDTLKSSYYKMAQNAKYLKDKCVKLETEVGELKKKLLSYEVQNRTMDSSGTTTPVNNVGSKQMRGTTSSYFSCGTNELFHGSTRSTESALARGFRQFRIPDPQSTGSRGLGGILSDRSDRSSDTNARFRIPNPRVARSAGTREIGSILSDRSEPSSDTSARFVFRRRTEFNN